jgi:lysophospholipase L1-like esterase
MIRRFWQLFVVVLAFSSGGIEARERGIWVEAYRSSPAGHSLRPSEQLPEPYRTLLADRAVVSGTVRQTSAVAVGGPRLRVRLSNEEGRVPLRIGAASVGLAEAGFAAQRGKLRPLTFNGKTTVVIPPGAPMLSDPVELTVAPLTELVISVLLPDGFKPAILGGAGLANLPGDHTLNPKMDGATIVPGRPIASGVLVEASAAARLIVTLGDSITDGNRSKPGELRGWPERLNQRLVAAGLSNRLAVLNAGIGANRVLQPGAGPPALARLDRDVLALPGVSHIVLLEGINDIGMAGSTPLFGDWPTLEPADLIAGYRQIIARAHLAGIKVVMGTILPFKGAPYYDGAKDRQREAVNDWIRTSGEPDFVIDFAARMADPTDSGRLNPSYDSGDHLHPNEAGYRAMGDAVDLAVFNP